MSAVHTGSPVMHEAGNSPALAAAADGLRRPAPTVDVSAPVQDVVAKVPAVTLGFWVLKVLATTLGETGGDAVSMSMGLGYLLGSAIFMALFVTAVAAQIAARSFRPALYWATIIASTMVGTTLADFADRSLGIGYLGGSALLLFLLLAALFAWRRTLGSVEVASVCGPQSESFYWLTIMFSQTLGTALGDWTADSAGQGYMGAALIFSGLLLVVAMLYWSRAKVSQTLLFWLAFILTRPLGAAVGDFLDKPVADGGLALSRYFATAVLLGLIAAGVVLLPQRAARRAH
jgi:uncharacterized membrane-anchored protein